MLTSCAKLKNGIIQILSLSLADIEHFDTIPFFFIRITKIRPKPCDSYEFCRNGPEIFLIDS